MFDIGFMELLLIGIVALLVLGPDKMPAAIRTCALWIGRARRSFNQVKSEIEQQLNADEIRRQLHNESILADIDKARKNADKLLNDTRQEFQQAGDQLKAVGDDLSKSVQDIQSMPVVTSSAEEGDIPDAPASLPGAVPADTVADDSSKADAAAEPTQADEQPAQESAGKAAKAPIEDIYNTPPTGVVTLQDGRLSAADQKS
jgi:sec-independent protein translocase protein TatB